MLDLVLIRLQYEILNTPLEILAEEAGVSVKQLRDEVTRGNWKQYWPDVSFAATSSSDPDADAFEVETAAYIESSRRRLKAYSLAKELLLARRYLTLESKIIDKATELVDTCVSGQEAKMLSALYKDLTSGSNLASLATMAIGQDESGLPTVIIRDLSGVSDR